MQNLKIYVVDDDQDGRLFLIEAITAVIQPVEIVEVLDGQDFMEIIQIEAVESNLVVVLMDMNMPRMNGLEVLKALQIDQKYKSISVIMVSTSRDETLMTEAYRLGAIKYYTKPFRMTEYQKLIEEINDTLIRNLLE